jgi:hypothetical protein
MLRHGKLIPGAMESACPRSLEDGRGELHSTRGHAVSNSHITSRSNYSRNLLAARRTAPLCTIYSRWFAEVLSDSGVFRFGIDRLPSKLYRRFCFDMSEHRFRKAFELPEGKAGRSGWRKCFGCLAHQLRLGGEIDHALQVAFGKRGIAQSALSFKERGVLLRVQMRSPFHRLLGADESRNDEIPDALMPLVHTTELIS